MTLSQRVYRWGWRLANRVRVRLGRPAQPKRCCRNEQNLGPIIRESAVLTYRRCRVCQCRHFELTADMGKFGVRAQ